MVKAVYKAYSGSEPVKLVSAKPFGLHDEILLTQRHAKHAKKTPRRSTGLGNSRQDEAKSLMPSIPTFAWAKN